MIKVKGELLRRWKRRGQGGRWNGGYKRVIEGVNMIKIHNMLAWK
jgi:hypothetical protein